MSMVISTSTWYASIYIPTLVAAKVPIISCGAKMSSVLVITTHDCWVAERIISVVVAWGVKCGFQ